MAALIVGLVFAGFGLWGVVVWSADFFLVCRGALPAFFLMGGVLAVIIGITTIRDSLKGKEEVKSEEIKEEKK
ncbi:MAG: hypothetical protein ABII74_07270 [Elusimicrobiota bacterium]